MSVETTVPSAERRDVITCYNVGTNGAVKQNDAVQLVASTSGSIPNIPAVNLAGATAGTVTYAFGVALNAAATGAQCAVAVSGFAKVTANTTMAVGKLVGLTVGTAGVRGRVSTAAVTTTAGTIRYRVLGRVLTPVTAVGQTCLVQINTAPVRQA